MLVIANILEVFLNIQTCFTSLFCKYGFITQIIYTWPKYKYHKKSIPSQAICEVIFDEKTGTGAEAARDP